MLYFEGIEITDLIEWIDEYNGFYDINNIWRTKDKIKAILRLENGMLAAILKNIAVQSVAPLYLGSDRKVHASKDNISGNIRDNRKGLFDKNTVISYNISADMYGYDKIMNVPYLSGCFMFFRTSAFETVGMFDERFFMYPEDIDITRRMHEKYRTVFYPNVSVIHDHAAESYKSKKMLKIHITNMIKYFNKWGWFFDSKRKRINKKILKELDYKGK